METVKPNPIVDEVDVTTPDIYVESGYPHEAWRVLRAEAPVYWYDRPSVEPFWALTKHADLQWVSKNPQIFSSAHGVNLRQRIDEETMRRFQEMMAAQGPDAGGGGGARRGGGGMGGGGGRMILNMD